MRSWKRRPLQNTGIPDPSTDSDAALALDAGRVRPDGRSARLVEILGTHCLHVFKFAGRLARQTLSTSEMEHTHLSTIGDIAITFKQVDRWIGHLPLKSIHDGTLAPLVADWRTRGLSNRTINIVLSRVRRVLRLAAMKWRDENNLTWLETPPC